MAVVSNNPMADNCRYSRVVYPVRKFIQKNIDKYK